MVVLVTGGKGQLGQALQAISGNYSGIQFYFAGSDEGNITKKDQLEKLFEKVRPDFCINAAAYTAVDKAESETDAAHAINVAGAKNIAETCSDFNTTLLHISTDFVFDGKKSTPYTETDETHPQGVYGATKREGELEIMKAMDKFFIVRTSWLYSDFGANFMKTMLRLGKERTSLGVVDDQTGTPTHAVDLAEALLTMIESGSKSYGIYHYSNEGQTTWYGFAKEIFNVNQIEIDLKPIATRDYPTPAKRPSYSVLDKTKIRETFGLTIRDWAESLRYHTKK
jgi:dTDP-4-dehydrorhamnose reductase